HGVGGPALGVAEQSAFRRADRRVIRAMHLRTAVDEIKDRPGRHELGETFTISLPPYAGLRRGGADRGGDSRVRRGQPLPAVRIRRGRVSFARWSRDGV